MELPEKFKKHQEYPKWADLSYDVIVMGSGLKECLISRLLSKKGMKVLNIDQNNYTGGETSSRNVKNLWEIFRPNKNMPNLYDSA